MPARLRDRVWETISRYNMLAGVSRLGVAVSGGADSVCLLHVLSELAPRAGIELHVVHLNHLLRGPASDEDARFVGELSRKLNFPCTIESADVASSSGNLEEAARNARLALFCKLMESKKVDRIATGHTSSDQAETVLHRFLRGSGTVGLIGIRPVHPLGLIRPLIDVTREDVIAYLKSIGQPWREDATNRDPAFVRNRIRHQLLPLLRSDYNPSIETTLAGTASVAADEESWWTANLPRLTNNIKVDCTSFGLEFDSKAAGELHAAVLRRFLRDCLLRVRGDLRNIDRTDVERMVGIVRGEKSSVRAPFPGGECIRSFDRILVTTMRPQPPEFAVELPESDSVIAVTNGCIRLHVIEISSICGNETPVSSYNEDGDQLDARLLSGPLLLRSWRPGDVFQRAGHKPCKLKELFQKMRIPIWERTGWPVLVNGERIVWTKQFGVGAGFEVTRGSRRVLQISH